MERFFPRTRRSVFCRFGVLGNGIIFRNAAHSFHLAHSFDLLRSFDLGRQLGPQNIGSDPPLIGMQRLAAVTGNDRTIRAGARLTSTLSIARLEFVCDATGQIRKCIFMGAHHILYGIPAH